MGGRGEGTQPCVSSFPSLLGAELKSEAAIIVDLLYKFTSRAGSHGQSRGNKSCQLSRSLTFLIDPPPHTPKYEHAAAQGYTHTTASVLCFAAVAKIKLQALAMPNKTHSSDWGSGATAQQPSHGGATMMWWRNNDVVAQQRCGVATVVRWCTVAQLWRSGATMVWWCKHGVVVKPWYGGTTMVWWCNYGAEVQQWRNYGMVVQLWCDGSTVAWWGNYDVVVQLGCGSATVVQLWHGGATVV